MEEQNAQRQMQMDKKLDDILEIVSFIKDNSVHKDDFNELKTDVSVIKADVSILKVDVSILKKDVSILKVDVADMKGDINRIRGHVKCLRFASEKTVEVLQEKRILTEPDKQRIYEAGQFSVATI